MDFGKISPRRLRLSDQIRDDLKRMILNGDLKRGAKLPNEEQLAVQLKVSKVSVREALRNLETEGLIEKRWGAHGGSFIARPGSDKMADWAVTYFRMGVVSLQELLELRQIMEPGIMDLAIERRTDKDLKAIKDVIDEIDEGVRQGKAIAKIHWEFHRLLGEASHSRLVSMVMKALVKVCEVSLPNDPLSLEVAKSDLEHCRKVYNCLVKREKRKARELIIDGLSLMSEVIEQVKQEGGS